MVAPVQQIYRYAVDRSDVIAYVDHWWVAFASENGAPELQESSVVGRVIWEFIHDEPTISLYREVHDHVRASGHAVEVPFRCDSPTLKRYMQLTIIPGNEGQLLYESKVIRTVPQHCEKLLEQTAQRSKSFLTMCSFCKRCLLEPSGWLEMEDISLRLRMDDEPSVPELHYTVCPNCANRLCELGAAN